PCLRLDRAAAQLPPRAPPPLLPYPTLFRSTELRAQPVRDPHLRRRTEDTRRVHRLGEWHGREDRAVCGMGTPAGEPFHEEGRGQDRKSTRLNSSHVKISYAVFCLKQKTSGE